MKTKTQLLFVLALLFGTKAFGQEWVYSVEYDLSDVEVARQFCAYEMPDGRIMVCSDHCYQSGLNIGGTNELYPPHSAMIALSSQGDVLAQNIFFKQGYWGASWFPYVFGNKALIFA